MTIQTRLGQVYVKDQGGSWGTAAGSFGAVDRMSCKPFFPKLVEEALATDTFRSGFHAQLVQSGSREGMEFTLEHTLQGVNASTPSADPTLQGGDALCLRSVLGSAQSKGYAGALSGSGQLANNIKYPDTTLSADWVGQAALLACSAYASGRRWVWAKTVTTAATPDELVPWVDLGTAPTASSVSYGSLTFWASNEAPQPFTVAVGYANGYGVIARDCVCTSAVLEAGGGRLPRIVYTVRAGYWTIEAIAWAAYTDQYPELPMSAAGNGAFLFMSLGEGDDLPSVRVEMTQSVAAGKRLDGVDGFGRYRMTERAQKVTITEILQGSGSGSGAFDEGFYPPGQAAAELQLDLCAIPGRGASLLVPSQQVLARATFEDENDLVIRKTELGCRPVTSESPTSGAGAVGSHFRFALG